MGLVISVTEADELRKHLEEAGQGHDYSDEALEAIIEEYDDGSDHELDAVELVGTFDEHTPGDLIEEHGAGFKDDAVYLDLETDKERAEYIEAHSPFAGFRALDNGNWLAISH